MLKKITLTILTLALVALAGIANAATWEKIYATPEAQLLNTSFSSYTIYVDKDSMVSNAHTDRKNGYECTALLKTEAAARDGQVSTLLEKWKVQTGLKEPGIHYTVTERMATFEGKTEKMADRATAAAAKDSQQEVICQMIILVDSERKAK